MYKVRKFEYSDAPNFFNDFKRFFPTFEITEETFLRKTFINPDFDMDGVFYLLKEDEKVGFAYAQVKRVQVDVGDDVEKSQGNIVFIKVSDDDAYPVGANLLIDAVENFVKSKGKTSITACGGTCYFEPGLDIINDKKMIEVFIERGYEHGQCIAQRIDLTTYEKPEKLVQKHEELTKQGFYIGPLTWELYLQFLSEQIFARPGWVSQFRKRVLFAPTDLERVIVAAKDGKILGGVIFGDPDSTPGRFGPFGVDRNYQGNGLGSVMLMLCLSEMKKRGIKSSYMQSSSPIGAAFTVYNRAGFKEYARYETMQKKL